VCLLRFLVRDACDRKQRKSKTDASTKKRTVTIPNDAELQSRGILSAFGVIASAIFAS